MYVLTFFIQCAFTVICACQVWLKFVGVFEISRRKGFCDLFRPCATLVFDFMTPKLTASCPFSWTIFCASLFQNRFICFQNIVFTNLVTDEQTDGQVQNIMPPLSSLAAARHKIASINSRSINMQAEVYRRSNVVLLFLRCVPACVFRSETRLSLVQLFQIPVAVVVQF